MTSEALRIEREDGTLILSFLGSLHGQVIGDIRQDIFRELEEMEDRVVLDFSELDYLSSSGIGLLVSILNRCRPAGCAVVVCGLQGDSLEIFRITRLTQIFEIFPTREEALCRS